MFGFGNRYTQMERGRETTAETQREEEHFYRGARTQHQLHNGKVTNHMPRNRASGQHGRKRVYPSAVIAFRLTFSGAPGRTKLDEILEEGLHKVQLWLKRGPQDPVTFSSLQNSLLGRSVCCLWARWARHALGPKCWFSGSSCCKFSLCAGSVVLFGFVFHDLVFTGQVPAVCVQSYFLRHSVPGASESCDELSITVTVLV